jgi:hypothetical protein
VDDTTQIDTAAVARCADAVAGVARQLEEGSARFLGADSFAADPLRHGRTTDAARKAEVWCHDAVAALGEEIRDLADALFVAATNFRTSDDVTARRLAGALRRGVR